MSMAQSPQQTLLLELDDKTWNTFLDRFEKWLGDLTMLQAAFTRLIKDTVGKIHEPHIRDYLGEIAQTSEHHEDQIKELYHLIGRDPSGARAAGGTVMGLAEELLATVQGVAGGAAGSWRSLRQLVVVNMDCLGAFGVAEQLGLALGLPQIADVTFPVIHEKQVAHLLLQKYMLEMASQAILYQSTV